MAQVQTSFSISGNEIIVGAINRMIEAIDDEFFYGADLNYEETSMLEAIIENIDLEGVLGWVSLFQTALKANGRDEFSFIIEGIEDNDSGCFTAFQIKCSQSSITKKEYYYDVDMSGDDADDCYEKIWDAEEAAKEALLGINEETLTNIRFNTDEYDVAVESAEEYFEEIE